MNRDTPLLSSSSAPGRRSNRFRSRSLEVAATALGASALADSASATIIYDLAAGASPNITFSIAIDGGPIGDIDLTSATTGMGGLDLIIEGPATGGMGSGSAIEFSVFSSGGGMATDYLTLLNTGDTVDASLTFASEAFMVEDSTINPAWIPGTTGYAGFVFDDGSGGFYGWAEIEFDASGTTFTVLQWAYDDTGDPITTGTMPEPSSAILLGLGLAALSVLFRKRCPARLVDATT